MFPPFQTYSQHSFPTHFDYRIFNRVALEKALNVSSSVVVNKCLVSFFTPRPNALLAPDPDQFRNQCLQRH